MRKVSHLLCSLFDAALSLRFPGIRELLRGGVEPPHGLFLVVRLLDSLTLLFCLLFTFARIFGKLSRFTLRNERIASMPDLHHVLASHF